MIDNIFTALVRKRTPGVITEFVLWCIVCFVALMSVVALAVGKGNATWIFLMIFTIGLGVLMAFRLKGITMLYSVGVFHLFMLIMHYVFLGVASGFISTVSIVLFVMAMLLAIAVCACACVQFFSRANLGTVLTILVFCSTGCIIVLQILLYATSLYAYWMNYKGYWVGTISYWILLAAIATYFACFFWGSIDQRRGKIVGGFAGGGGSRGGYPSKSQFGLEGISGAYNGQVVYLHGGTVTIGSGSGVTLQIPDSYVSSMHCAIRYNAATGYYEILDQSTNGVSLSNGMQMQKGVYNSVRRGSVICIGSVAQQFRLL